MDFRVHRSACLGPVHFNFSSGGLSSISVGGRCASFNIPVNRPDGPRTTVGLPGTGLSWSVKHTPDRLAAIPAESAKGLPNSRRLRPGQLDVLKQSLLAVLRWELFVPGARTEQERSRTPRMSEVIVRWRDSTLAEMSWPGVATT